MLSSFIRLYTTFVENIIKLQVLHRESLIMELGDNLSALFEVHELMENPKDYGDVDKTRWGFDDVILASSRDPSESKPMIALVQNLVEQAS